MLVIFGAAFPEDVLKVLLFVTLVVALGMGAYWLFENFSVQVAIVAK